MASVEPPTEPAASPPSADWATWGVGQVRAFLTVVVGAVSTLGFVAFTGGVILWARATALHVPADQVVAVAPRRELIAMGASALTIFGVTGIVAAGILYLFDRYGRPSRHTRIGLLVLLAVELIAALAYADDDRVGCAILVAVVAVLGLGFVQLAGRFTTGPYVPPTQSGTRCSSDPPAADWTGLRDSILKSILDWGAAVKASSESKGPDSPAADASSEPKEPDSCDAKQPSGAKDHDRVDMRLTTEGSGFVLAVMVGATVVLWLIYDRHWWIAVWVGLAFALHLVVIAVARASGGTFAGTGAAVVGSVVVYGAALSALRYFEDKHVQPVAALRTGEATPVCGIYLTASDDRLYLARIDPKRRPTTGDSSHLFWVDKKTTAGAAIGVLQSQRAAEAALSELSARVLEERRPNVEAKTSVTRTTTATAPNRSRASSKSPQKPKKSPRTQEKRPQKRKTSQKQTSSSKPPIKTVYTEETKTQVARGRRTTPGPPCSIYSSPAS